MISEHDERKRRCPMLGHDIAFHYCRTTSADTVCRRIFTCWWETFDIAAFMEAHYTPEQIAALTAPAQPKVLSLYELIQQAQKVKD